MSFINGLDELSRPRVYPHIQIDRRGAAILKSLQITDLVTFFMPYGLFMFLGKIIRMNTMSRRCELTGKTVQTGNNVSHAKNRTRRRFLPNLCNVNLLSETLGESFRLKISAYALRTIEHRGGLDSYLAKAKDQELSLKARRLKRKIMKSKAGDDTASDSAAA